MDDLGGWTDRSIIDHLVLICSSIAPPTILQVSAQTKTNGLIDFTWVLKQKLIFEQSTNETK